MATNTLTQNINQAISDFNGVRQAIIEKGVEIPSGTPTSQYSAKISEIQSGGGGGVEPTIGYQITEWDEEGYPVKIKIYGMTEIPAGFFGNDYYSNSGGFLRLSDVSAWGNVSYIGDYAFSGCYNLALTSLPEGLTGIGINAFSGCYNLALTSLPEGLTYIGSSVFSDCSKLALTSLPEGVTGIGMSAFSCCTGLKTLTIGSAIKTISSYAFGGCTNLTSITINRAEGTVSGAPWGATKATIKWVGNS